MRVLTRGSGGKPATDERTGSVEAILPSGYSRHHEEAGSRDEEQNRAAGYLLPDPTEGSLSSTRAEGRLYPLGISGKFGARVIRYSLVIS